MDKFIVEVFENNNFVFYSSHRNKENAETNCAMIGKSRKTDARIIHKGKIEGTYTWGK